VVMSSLPATGHGDGVLSDTHPGVCVMLSQPDPSSGSSPELHQGSKVNLLLAHDV